MNTPTPNNAAHPRQRSAPRCPASDAQRPAPAFSLIELLAVIAIIIIILGLGVGGMNMMYKKSESARTRAILGGLKAAADEYFASTGQNLAYENFGKQNFDSLEPDERMELFLERVQQIESCKKILLTLGKPGEVLIYDNDDDPGDTTEDLIAIQDPWREEIRFYRHNREDDSDEDENHPPYDGLFFVSFGPDGEAGDYNDGDPDEAHEDNIYSYEVE